MKQKIKNLLESLAPLSTKKIDMGEVMIVSFLQSQWQTNQNVQVNDVLDNVKHLSTASINRKLKQLKKVNVLTFINSESDMRIKFIKKGLNFDSYVQTLEKIIDGHEQSLSKIS